MTENLNIALQLMLVGMLSVFFILGIVIGLGKLLITLVNRFSKEAVKPTTRPRSVTPQFSSKHLAVLSAVVDTVTSGNGVIKSVKKIKD